MDNIVTNNSCLIRLHIYPNLYVSIRYKEHVRVGNVIVLYVHAYSYISSSQLYNICQRQTDRRTDGRTGGQADRRTGGQADRRTVGQADRRTVGQADRWTDGQTDFFFLAPPFLPSVWASFITHVDSDNSMMCLCHLSSSSPSSLLQLQTWKY